MDLLKSASLVCANAITVLLVIASPAVANAAAQVRKAPVTVTFDGQGKEEIGKLFVIEAEEGVFAKFLLAQDFRWLDNCYDFRWITVLETAGFAAEQPGVGTLPAIDPSAGAFDEPPDHEDDEPFFWSTQEYFQPDPASLLGPPKVEGISSKFSYFPENDPTQSVNHVFVTYLVAVQTGPVSGAEECDIIGRKDVCVLRSVRWVYSMLKDNVHFTRFELADEVAPLILALANGVDATPPHDGNPGFPGWQAITADDHVFCKCRRMADIIPPTTLSEGEGLVSMGPAILLNANDDVIGETFIGGAQPIADDEQISIIAPPQLPVRTEFTLDYEPGATSGNDPMQVVFAIILDDAVPPSAQIGFDFIPVLTDPLPGKGPIVLDITLDIPKEQYEFRFDREGAEPLEFTMPLLDFPRALPPELTLLPISRWFDLDGPPELPPCLGDLNLDGRRDGADIGQLLAQWDGSGSADLNGDGIVDGADLGLFLGGFGPCGCGTASSKSCFSAHETPGCNDAECCAIVCADLPVCCEVAWDEACAEFATSHCSYGLSSGTYEDPTRTFTGIAANPDTLRPVIDLQFPDGCNTPDGPVQDGTLQWEQGGFYSTPPCYEGCPSSGCGFFAVDTVKIEGVLEDDDGSGTLPRIGLIPLRLVSVPGIEGDPPEARGCPIEVILENEEFGLPFSVEFELGDVNPILFNQFMIGGSRIEAITVTYTREYCESEPGPCCVPGSEPGCSSDPKCELAVCAFDPFCCESLWDDTCAVVATLLCSACEGLLPCSDADCCTEHKTPGCSDLSCCEAVCTLDPFCCGAFWDEFCVFKATAICKSCGGGVPCGDGDCCQANGSAGCTDPLCCALVCQELPACCDVEWDATCASIALSACPGCSGGG